MDVKNELSGYPAGAWVRAGRCGPNGGNCVELNHARGDLVGVRDSKGMELLNFRRKDWGAFIARIVG